MNNSIYLSLTVLIIWLWVNESLGLSLTSSLKVEFDSIEIEAIMGQPNCVRV